MPAPYTGGCACGQVRYRLDAEPLTLYACHCSYCQAQSGSAFGLSMPVRRDAVVVTTSAAVRYEFVAPDGRRRAGARCGVCPTRLWGEPERLPDVLVLRPGTLDDRSWVQPIAHIWTSRAQPWVRIPDGVLAFAEQPDDERVLVRAWRTRRGPVRGLRLLGDPGFIPRPCPRRRASRSTRRPSRSRRSVRRRTTGRS